MFGQRLRELREKRGVTTKGLAKEIGVSQPYLSNVERGKGDPLSIERIAQVATVLGLTEGEHLELRAMEAIARGRISLDLGDLDESEKLSRAVDALQTIERIEGATARVQSSRTLIETGGFQISKFEPRRRIWFTDKVRKAMDTVIEALEYEAACGPSDEIRVLADTAVASIRELEQLKNEDE